jgi:hypothetical protein
MIPRTVEGVGELSASEKNRNWRKKIVLTLFLRPVSDKALVSRLFSVVSSAVKTYEENLTSSYEN